MNVVTSRAQFRFFNVKKCEEECQLQLILSNVLICGHPVGGDPGDMARDFSTNGANFKLGMGLPLNFRCKISGKDKRDSFCRRLIGDGAGNTAEGCDHYYEMILIV